jgi:hypothetical protein
MAKSTLIKPKLCRHDFEGVVNLFPKDQNPNPSKSKQILKYIFQLKVFFKRLKNSDPHAHEEFAKSSD